MVNNNTTTENTHVATGQETERDSSGSHIVSVLLFVTEAQFAEIEQSVEF